MSLLKKIEWFLKAWMVIDYHNFTGKDVYQISEKQFKNKKEE
jgi:hypothetical protein